MRIALASLLLLGGVRIGPASADTGVHVDDDHGIRLEYPSDWKRVPLMHGERWIIAKYASPKVHRIARVKAQREIAEERHAPRLHLLYLPAKKRTGGGTYDGYVDWLLKAMSNAKQGFYLVDEHPEAIAGHETTRMEHKLEKGESAQADIPRRLVSWVFKRGKDQYVVEFEILEDRYEEDVKMCEDIVQTFTFTGDRKVFPALGVGTKPKAKTYDLRRMSDRLAWQKLPLEERTKYREDEAAAVWKHARSASPSHWDMRTWPHFYFLSERSQSSSQPYVDSIESLMGWLEENLGGVNDGPIARIVYRLFADTGSYRSFYSRSADTTLTELAGLEDPRSSGGSLDFDKIHATLIGRYMYAKLGPFGVLQTKDLPVWIQMGLKGVAEGIKAGKRFVPDTEDDYGYVRDAEKADAVLSARALMTMTRKDYTRKGAAKQKMWEWQARILFHFILKEQRRSRLLGKDFVTRYIQRAAEIRHEQLLENASEAAAAAKKGADAKRSLTPEEKERLRIEAQRHQQEQEEMLLEQLILDLCNWHDREWKRFEKKFASELK